MKWIEFDALELVPQKNWPRVIAKRFFEINPLGEVRYLEALTKRPHYRTLKPVIINNEPYFMATLGWNKGCQIVVRKEIKELVNKYF